MRTNTVDSGAEIDVLHSPINIEMSEDLHNFNFQKIIGEILLYLLENLNVIT